jgi:hypothetical protein
MPYNKNNIYAICACHFAVCLQDAWLEAESAAAAKQVEAILYIPA